MPTIGSNKKVREHRNFLRSRAKARSLGLRGYPQTRTTKEINEGQKPRRVNQSLLSNTGLGSRSK